MFNLARLFFTLFTFFTLISCIPFTASPNLGRPQHLRRDIPPIPERPAGVGPNSFHGSQFAYFDDIGFPPGSPAVEAAPVFLFSRTRSNDDPCYPESAVVLGSNPPRPNPGTGGIHGVASINPGADCTNPGPYHGEMSLGNAFPVYVGAVFCGADSVWKLNFDVYYVHDGNLMAGHRHDWEGITIVFAKDPAANGDDWWYRAGAQYNHHSDHDWFKYSDLITVAVDVPGTSDVTNNDAGKNLNHPKVFVGFFSHSAYDRADTSIRVNAGKPSVEYRSDDWWRLPRAEDLHSWKEIDRNWGYGDATSKPSFNHENMCGDEWKLGELSPP